MSEPAEHIPTVTNVVDLPPAPRLRVVKEIEAAERSVTELSERVRAVLADNQPTRKPRKPSEPKKPRAKKADPILEASRTNDTRPTDVTGVHVLAEPDPVAEPIASAAGPELLLSTVLDTAQPPAPPPLVRFKAKASAAWDWVRIIGICLSIAAAGWYAAHAFHV
jgi:hypothetical protein